MDPIDICLVKAQPHQAEALPSILIPTINPTIYQAHSEPTSQDLSKSHAVEKDPQKPDIMAMSPADVPQGLQSMTNLTGSSAMSLPTAFQSSEDMYKASIEDWKQIFGQNIVPQHASKNLLQLIWLALKDKVLVCQILSTYSVSLLLSLFQYFGQPCPNREPLDWGHYHPCCHCDCRSRQVTERLAKGEAIQGAQWEERRTHHQGHPWWWRTNDQHLQCCRWWCYAIWTQRNYSMWQHLSLVTMCSVTNLVQQASQMQSRSFCTASVLHSGKDDLPSLIPIVLLMMVRALAGHKWTWIHPAWIYLAIWTALSKSSVEVRLSKGLVHIWWSLSDQKVSTGISWWVCPLSILLFMFTNKATCSVMYWFREHASATEVEWLGWLQRSEVLLRCSFLCHFLTGSLFKKYLTSHSSSSWHGDGQYTSGPDNSQYAGSHNASSSHNDVQYAGSSNHNDSQYGGSCYRASATPPSASLATPSLCATPATPSPRWCLVPQQLWTPQHLFCRMFLHMPQFPFLHCCPLLTIRQLSNQYHVQVTVQYPQLLSDRLFIFLPTREYDGPWQYQHRAQLPPEHCQFYVHCICQSNNRRHLQRLFCKQSQCQCDLHHSQDRWCSCPHTFILGVCMVLKQNRNSRKVREVNKPFESHKQPPKVILCLVHLSMTHWPLQSKGIWVERE